MCIDRATGEFISGGAVRLHDLGQGPRSQDRPAEAKTRKRATTRAASPRSVVPGPGGAHTWQPMSYSPLTKLVYFPVMEAGFVFIPGDEAEDQHDRLEHRRGFQCRAACPPIPRCSRASRQQLKGHLVAWDPVAQKEVWRAQFEHPWNGGTLATAGNLVFHGNSQGEFVAYRATNGQKLWSAPTQAGVLAAPDHLRNRRRTIRRHRSGLGRRLRPRRRRAGARCAHRGEHSARAGRTSSVATRSCPSCRQRQAASARAAGRDRRRGRVDGGQGRVSHVLRRLPRRFGGQRRRDSGSAAVAGHARSRRPGSASCAAASARRAAWCRSRPKCHAEDSEKVRAYVIHRAHEDPEASSRRPLPRQHRRRDAPPAAAPK